MTRTILLVAALVLGGCGLRVGTDTAGVTAGETWQDLLQISWWKDSTDTSILVRRDTLPSDSLAALVPAIPLDSWLSVAALDSSRGAWLRPGTVGIRLVERRRTRTRWFDARRREGAILSLPGTGVEVPLAPAEGWSERTVSVFADRWPARIVRDLGGRRLVWSIDSVGLGDTLSLDLSSLPDSSCPIQPGLPPSTWECRPR